MVSEIATLGPLADGCWPRDHCDPKDQYKGLGALEQGLGLLWVMGVKEVTEPEQIFHGDTSEISYAVRGLLIIKPMQDVPTPKCNIPLTPTRVTDAPSPLGMIHLSPCSSPSCILHRTPPMISPFRRKWWR